MRRFKVLEPPVGRARDRAVQPFMEAQNRSNFLFYAIPGKSASRFAWENRAALSLELL
ncbi:hypothetical protein GGE59_001707 [Rhizobium leguminosarum]|nr:hypothetical protein [Rhizobium leguminosarum]MBB4430236.1 hypothetical protein [Rhizobium esperanzae]MBB4541146.1 hypothetical protein [Rhizobium leguminosarum]MBB5652472.1 hypothetical protein [Rhizobium leguminosarum]MBB5678769.1 hypothetical protein [Rhizobium leguminosarum]